MEHGLLMENLLDLAHAPFTHTSTFARGWPIPESVCAVASQASALIVRPGPKLVVMYGARHYCLTTWLALSRPAGAFPGGTAAGWQLGAVPH